ncbi:MAG: bifunctional folylpolyglutamate synthase/dihydrofolate synthase [gamma proteobacterium symbiont of Taylorina sp.]|nr:bifunctional folylpolyglutamate synthase/dihydrofolate synthase [gamma proteobacterium symbiont of Taylorina sp.]
MTPTPSQTSNKTLQQWLSWQEGLHPVEIDLGLERVNQVIQVLLADFFDIESQQFHFPFKIITIAGTNGKGSTVAMLEAILTQAGYCVGSYTSPHLLHYNERIKINQRAVSDQIICQAFERINNVRREISLSYFEFATLAAIDIFCALTRGKALSTKKKCDVVILEVGLGGRLDAVNVVDADIALVTTVDLDHQDWLGSDRNSIALEKAGIYRKNKPAIYGDTDMPESLLQKVLQEDLDFFQFSQDYDYEIYPDKNSRAQNPELWQWLAAKKHKHIQSRNSLPMPQLMGKQQLKNASNALMVLELLNKSLPVSQLDINNGLSNTNLIGRFQIISTAPGVILDVAHNEQAAKKLRQTIDDFIQSDETYEKRIHVIVGMLKDKDVTKVLSAFNDIVSSWRLINLDTPRAMPATDIKQILETQLNQLQMDDDNIKTFSYFNEAYEDFREYNGESSKQILLVFGSFHTVSDALIYFNKKTN